MKNLLILLTIFLQLTINCFSQDKGYVSFSIGPSIPIGDFASKAANNNSAGFATTGGIIDFSFAYKLGKNFGVSALLRGQANNFDDGAFASELANQTGQIWTVNSKPWSIGGLMIGGYGTFPISNKVSFDAKAMLGFLLATSPELYVVLNGSGGTVWINESSASATSFSYLLSAGFKYNVSKKICLLTNLDYLGAKPEFRDLKVTSSNGGAPKKETYRQNFGTINFEFGVGFRI